MNMKRTHSLPVLLLCAALFFSGCGGAKTEQHLPGGSEESAPAAAGEQTAPGAETRPGEENAPKLEGLVYESTVPLYYANQFDITIVNDVLETACSEAYTKVTDFLNR